MNFEMDYGKNCYKLPGKFNEEAVIKEITHYMSFFKNNEIDFYCLASDFLSILGNQFENLHFEKKNFSVNYSESERNKHKKEMFKNGLKASQEMEHEKNEIKAMKNVKNPSDLPVYLNEEPYYLLK